MGRIRVRPPRSVRPPSLGPGEPQGRRPPGPRPTPGRRWPGPPRCHHRRPGCWQWRSCRNCPARPTAGSARGSEPCARPGRAHGHRSLPATPSRPSLRRCHNVGATPDQGHGGYSHSMVPGGLLVMSYTTRLTPGTSLTIRLEMRDSTS